MPQSVRASEAAKNEQTIVHVIDDDVSLRDALGLMLPSVGLDVRTYASVQEFLDGADREGPGCIVLDVRLPGISGLDFQTRRHGFGVHLPIVLMTGHSDVPMSVRAMKAGAVDFLPKPFRDQDMIDAVKAAIERDRERRAADGASADIRTRYASLSPREQQVMMLVTAGKMNKQVAFELGLSVITVKTYRGAVMQKMSARSFADLVRMADVIRQQPHTKEVPPPPAGMMRAVASR
jgi:FixJ family two-component response regulator